MGPPCDAKEHWIILGGALYCNYDDHPQEEWIRNFAAYKQAADDRWVGYYGSLQAGPMNDACYPNNTCVKECGYCGPPELSDTTNEIE